jgi:parallel beta-helix repeat protein
VVGSSDIVWDGDVYCFISDIDGQVIVEVDDIIIDGGRDNGYSLRATSSVNGVVLKQRRNVIIRYTAIIGAKNRVKIENSYGCVVESCLITGSRLTGIRVVDCLERNLVLGNIVSSAGDEGILLSNSSNTIVYGNIVEGVDGDGVDLEGSNGNYIHGNTIRNIVYQAIDLDHSHGHILYENICSGCFNNVHLFRSSDNQVYHNNFLASRGIQVDSELSVNIWNEPYPSCGNYWEDYTGQDILVGIDQSQAAEEGGME